jgi:DNA polymerase III subunit alpha
MGMEAYVAPGDRGTAPLREGREGPTTTWSCSPATARATGTWSSSPPSATRRASTSSRASTARCWRSTREGLIVTSACMAGEVARHLMEDRWDGRARGGGVVRQPLRRPLLPGGAGARLRGPGRAQQKIFALADELGLPVVATNDAHFLRAEDHEAHDVLLCIGLGKDRDDPNRMRYDGGSTSRAPRRWRSASPAAPDVLENTLGSPTRSTSSFEKQYHVPEFPLPEELRPRTSCWSTCARGGAKERYGDPLPPPAGRSGSTTSWGDHQRGPDYAGYFLITAGLHPLGARARHPGGPRPRLGGGLARGLRARDHRPRPLEFDLLFERFLNPERVSMPDIDIDFCFERRGEVIEYVREKYGRTRWGRSSPSGR